MKLLFVALFLCVVAVHCGDFPRDGTWEEQSAWIKTQLMTKLGTMTPTEKMAAIEAGIKYLQGEGPKPDALSTIGAGIVETLSTGQKQQILTLLRSMQA